MDKKIKFRLITALPSLFIILGGPIFLAAWTFDYWQAWVFITVFSIATVVHGLILWKYAPDVLMRRMKAGPTAEKRPVQRIIMTGIMLSFVLF